jgi:hypothetical protein
VAQVAFGDGLAAFDVAPDGPKGADHDAHLAAYALVFVAEDGVGEIIPVYSPCETGLDTGRFATVATLHGERQWPILLLHQHPWQGSRHLISEGFDDLLGLGMLYQAVDLAEPAADAVFLIHIDTFHGHSPT